MGKDKPSPDKPPPSMPEEIKGADPSPLPGPPPAIKPPAKPAEEGSGPAEVAPEQNLTLEEKLDILAEKVRRRRNAKQAPKILTQIDLPAIDINDLKEVKRKKPRKAAAPKLATEPLPPEAPPEPAPVPVPTPVPAAEPEIESPPKPKRSRKPPVEEVQEGSDAVQIAELQATILKLNEELKSLKRKLNKKEAPPKPGDTSLGPAEHTAPPKASVDPNEDEVSIALPDADRRKYFRFKLDSVKLMFFRVGLLEKLGVSRNIGRALVDISEGGCSAIIVREVAAYAPVRILIEMPKFKQSLELLGEVRWCSKLSRDLWEAGVVFSGMNPRDLGILRDWTQSPGS